MNKSSTKKLIKDISRPVAETATIVSVEIDRVSIQIGSSPNVMRNVNVMGSTNTLAPGMTVRIMWVDRRPVVVGGASSDVGTVSLSMASTTTDLPIHTHLDNLSGGILASYMSAAAHNLLSSHILGVNVPHDDHGYLSGLGDDDHGQYVHLSSQRTITAMHVLNTAGAPFSLGAGAMGQTVFGLKADQLNKSVTATSGLTGGGALTGDLTISLGMPSTLTEASTNTNTGTTHAHAVTASASPGISASLLKTDVTGLLTLNSLAITNSAQLKGSTVARSIGPEASYTYDLGSLGYWWRKLFASEMAGAVMSEYTQTLTGGWLTVTKDQGTLAAAVASAATTMDFGKSMASYIGNIVLIRHLDSAGANKVEFVSITSPNAGTVYNVSRDVSAQNVTDPAWAAGTPYAVLGTTNDGYIELDAFDSPRFSIFKKTGAAWNASSEIMRLGDLTGHPVAGASDVGLFIGDASQYLKYFAGVLTISGNGSGLTQINGGNIQTGTITAAKLSVTSLSAVTANMGALTVDNTLTISGGGKLLAGGGTVVLDTAGLKITSDLDPMYFTPSKALNFIDNSVSSSVAAYVTGYTYYTAMGGYDTFNTMDIRVPQKSDREGAMSLYCYGHHSSSIELLATQSYTGLISNLTMYSDGNSGSTGIRLTTNSTIGKIDLNGKTISVSGDFNVSGKSYPHEIFPKYGTWATLGDGGAGIVNEATTYQSLMVIGNTSAGGLRQVKVWDDLTVSNRLVSVGNSTQVTNLNSHYLNGLSLGQSPGTIPYVDGNGIFYSLGATLYGTKNIGVSLLSGNVNISNASADNIISFGGLGANYDDVPAGYAAHWSGGDPTKVYIRVAGTYQVSASCVWPINATGTHRFMGVKVNNSWLCIDSRPPQSTTNMWQSMSFVWKFAAGDALTLIMRQDSTANPLVVISAMFYSIAFRIARIA